MRNLRGILYISICTFTQSCLSPIHEGSSMWKVRGIFCQGVLDFYFHRHCCSSMQMRVPGCLRQMPLALGCLWLPLSRLHATSAAYVEFHVSQPLATVTWKLSTPVPVAMTFYGKFINWYLSFVSQFLELY